jgi:hypothetical protein
MKKVELSKLDPTLNLEELINFLLDNKCDTVINNIIGPPHVEYELDDLYVVWDRLKKII